MAAMLVAFFNYGKKHGRRSLTSHRYYSIVFLTYDMILDNFLLLRPCLAKKAISKRTLETKTTEEFADQLYSGETYSFKKFKGIFNFGQDIRMKFENIKDSTLILNQFVMKFRKKKIDAVLCKKDRKTLELNLRDHYSRVTSWLIPLPWFDELIYPSEDYFVEPNFVERSRDGKKDKNDVVLSDIFAEPHYSQVSPKRILVRGEAGYGKTTICIHLAHTWATESRDFLSKFKYLLFFRLRDIDDSNDVESVLQTEIMKFAGTEVKLEDATQLVRSISASMLLILDGYDECRADQMASVDGLLTTTSSSNPFREATILLTSRYPPNTSVYKYFSKHILLTGLSESKRDTLLETFFRDRFTRYVSYFKDTFSCLYQSKDLSPLLLYLLCFVLEEINESEVEYNFTSTFELIEEVVMLLGKRCCDRECLNLGIGQINRQFVLLGNLFHEALKRGEYYIRETSFSTTEGLLKSFVLKCGVIVKRTTSFGYVYEPLHKTFMEHLCIKYFQSRLETRDKEEDVDFFIAGLDLPLHKEIAVDIDSYNFYIAFEVHPGIFFRWRLRRLTFSDTEDEPVSLFTSQFVDTESFYFKRQREVTVKSKRLKPSSIEVVISTNYGNNSCSLTKIVECNTKVAYLKGLASRLQLLLRFMSEYEDEPSIRCTFSTENTELYQLNYNQEMEVVSMVNDVKYFLPNESWFAFNKKLRCICCSLLGCVNKVPDIVDNITFFEYAYGLMSTLATNRFSLDVLFELQAPDEKFRYFCKYFCAKRSFHFILQRYLGERSNGFPRDDNFFECHLNELDDVYFMDNPENLYLNRKRPHFLRFNNETNSGDFKFHLRLYDTLNASPTALHHILDEFSITDVFRPRPIIKMFSESLIEIDKRYLCVFVSCH